MSTLTGWNLAAMVHETSVFQGDVSKAAHFLGGLLMGMAIANLHPEYAQAAVKLSQEQYLKEKSDKEERLEDGVSRFIQAVPIELLDKKSNG